MDKRLKETVVRKVKAPVEDVHSMLAPAIVASPPDANVSAVDWKWIWILNGIGLIGLSIWLWRRGSLEANPTSATSGGESRK